MASCGVEELSFGDIDKVSSPISLVRPHRSPLIPSTRCPSHLSACGLSATDLTSTEVSDDEHDNYETQGWREVGLRLGSVLRRIAIVDSGSQSDSDDSLPKPKEDDRPQWREADPAPAPTWKWQQVAEGLAKIFREAKEELDEESEQCERSDSATAHRLLLPGSSD